MNSTLKKVAVPVAQLSRFVLLAATLSFPEVSLAQAECKRLTRSTNLDKPYEDLQQLIDSTIIHINDPSKKGISKLFHPRSKVNDSLSKSIDIVLSKKHSKPWKISLFRVFELYSPEKARELIKCDSDEYLIRTRYGYEKQWAIWLQLMSRNEVSRIFFSVADLNGEKKITGFHIQQWTHQQKEWIDWAQDAAKLADLDIKSFAYYDIAEKLLSGGDFIYYPAIENIRTSKTSIMSEDQLLTRFQTILETKDLVTVKTELVADGLGWILRYRIDKPTSTDEIREQCHKWFKKIQQVDLIEAGLRCSPLGPTEDPNKEGASGSIFISPK